MKKGMSTYFLGRGLQYNVTLIHPRRVLKTETTQEQKEKVLRSWGETPASVQKYVQRGNRDLLSSLDLVSSHLNLNFEQSAELWKLLGRPIFCAETTSYSQDYGLAPIELVRRSPKLYTLIYRQMVRDYTQLTYRLWSFGLHDRIMNFYTNCSYLPNDSFILHDFGELTGDYSLIREQLTSEHFRRSSTYRNRSNTAQRKFLTTYFRRHLTVEELDKYWRIAL